MEQMPDSRSEEYILLCIDRLLDGEWTANDCLERTSVSLEELAPYLDLVDRLSLASSVRPRADFRRDASRRLQQRITPRPKPRRWIPTFFRPGQALRPASSFALILLVLITVFGFSAVGVARAADAAVPGDSLYVLDRRLEQVELSMRSNAQERARLQLQHADERLEEALTLTWREEPSLAEEALVAYAVQMSEIELDAGNNAELATEIDEELGAQEHQLEVIYSELAPLVAVNDNAGGYCAEDGNLGDAVHPMASSISAQYGVTVLDVMRWFCSSYGFGEIVIALVAAEKYDESPEMILALKDEVGGWGRVTQELDDGLQGRPLSLPTVTPAPGEDETTEPQDEPSQEGRPDEPGPPEDPGPPDDAGRPDDPGPPSDDGPPGDSGPPDDPGPPEGQGPPDDAGQPEDPGPPEDPGQSEDTGPAGGAGPPEDPGGGSNSGNQGQGNNNNGGRSNQP